MGDSIGTWEGDTLVIDTTQFKGGPWTWLDSQGHQHSASMRVVEKLRRVPAGIEYQATIYDPTMYAKPWILPKRMFEPLKPLAGFEELMEYSCNENNRDLQHLVSTKTVDYRWDLLHPRQMLHDNRRGAIFVAMLIGAICAIAAGVLWRVRTGRRSNPGLTQPR